MKKLISICLVVLLVSSIAFASGNEQKQEQEQAQGQGQFQGIENVGNTGDSTYNSTAPAVAPYGVGLPWQMPTKNNLWNDLAVNPLELGDIFVQKSEMVHIPQTLGNP